MTDLEVQMIFSPQNCSLEVLERTLTRSRRELAERLMAQIDRMAETGTAHHNLVIGSRGSGKTHLLSYVLKKRGETPEPIVIRLSEEERGIASLLDFLVACLAAAGMSQDDIVDRITRGTVSERVDAARELFREQIGKRPTLIVLENLSDMFDRFDEGELRSLRGFLQEHPNVSILASSVALFTSSSSPDQPFYGFFTIHSLEPLDRFETRLFLAALAWLHGQHDVARELEKEELQKRVNAIHQLTGGNHRLLAMLSRFLSAEGLKELVDPFVEMVDRELTPYYQQRLDRLTPQQNKILRAVASLKLGGSLTVKEVAHYTMLTSQVVSRQLHDLLHESYVVRDQRGRESYYGLREPLLRLALDIKEGRGGPLPTIVDFLRRWYEPAELETLLNSAPAQVRLYYEEALAAATESAVAQGTKRVVQLLRKGADLLRQSRPRQALECFDELVRVEPDECVFWFARAFALEDMGRLDEALLAYEKGECAYDNPLGRFAGPGEPLQTGMLAMALDRRACALRELGHLDQAIATCDRVLEQFGQSDLPALLTAVASALLEKGNALHQQDRFEDAIAAYEEVVLRFKGSDEPTLVEHVAKALLLIGFVLCEQERFEDAVAECDKVAEWFAAPHHPALLEYVADALRLKGLTLMLGNRHQEALVVWDEVLSCSPLDGSAVANRLATLLAMNRTDQAFKGLHEALGQHEFEKDERADWAGRFVDHFTGESERLREVVQVFGDETEAVASGLTKWLQVHLPLGEEDIAEFEEAEGNLKAVLGDVEEAQMALRMIEAARKDAQGDTTALLSLPIELRQLIEEKKDKG